MIDPHQLWVVGFGSSGGKWLERMFMDVLGIYDPATDGPTKRFVIARQYWTLDRPPGGKVCFIYRDPRDMIMSLSRFWSIEVDEVLYPVDQPPLLPTLSNFFQTWLMELEPEGATRYEHLLADPEKEMTRLLDRLGIPYAPEQVTEAVRRQTYKSNGGQQQRWREFLTHDQGGMINYWLGDWLHRMGYEMNPAWWEKLPA